VLISQNRFMTLIFRGRLFSLLLLISLHISWSPWSTPRLVVEAFSYSVPGEWKDTTLDIFNSKYREQFLQVFGNHTWITSTKNIYDRSNACKGLVDKGIDSIYFYGDSYMRQIYAAVAITLSGNYINGSISTSEYAKNSGGGDCIYHKQFNEKHCGIRQLEEDAVVCEGNIHLHHMHHGMFNIDSCRGRAIRQGAGGKAINIFSTGNHKIGESRYGINDAEAHQKLFDASFCTQLRQEKNEIAEGGGGGLDKANGCSNWWVSTHHRIIGWFPDEKGPVTIAYNEGMRQYFDSDQCGDYNYIDVYNMTQSLVETFTLDATCEENKSKSMSVSYDYVHFGMEVNLVKAQIILDAWIQGLDGVSASPRPRKHRRRWKR
jgi:hypothetical protein